MTIEEMNEIATKGFLEERERTRRSEEAIANGKARPYEEVLDDLNYHTQSWDRKKLRRLHKELKYYGDGVSLVDRYGFELVASWMIIGAVGVGVALAVLVALIA